jgi:hypothetical protein
MARLLLRPDEHLVRPTDRVDCRITAEAVVS